VSLGEHDIYAQSGKLLNRKTELLKKVEHDVGVSICLSLPVSLMHAWDICPVGGKDGSIFEGGPSKAQSARQGTNGFTPDCFVQRPLHREFVEWFADAGHR